MIDYSFTAKEFSHYLLLHLLHTASVFLYWMQRYI